MKNIVIFSGAGISKPSGLDTFRGNGGLWEGYAIEKVASPKGWLKNRELVLSFYNKRRKQVIDAQPNKAHQICADLEKDNNVTIITQNIDDLHERAGSSNIIHLHGEIKKAQSSHNPNLVYPIKGDTLSIGEKCSKGSQLRPHVVFFEESILRWKDALKATEECDIFIIIGTSMSVQPAASLINFTKKEAKVYVIDPELKLTRNNTTIYNTDAIEGMEKVSEEIKKANPSPINQNIGE